MQDSVVCNLGGKHVRPVPWRRSHSAFCSIGARGSPVMSGNLPRRVFRRLEFVTAYRTNPRDNGSCRPEWRGVVWLRGSGVCGLVGCRGWALGESGSLATQRLHLMMEIHKICNGARKDGGRVDFQTRPSAYLRGWSTAGTPTGTLDLALISGPGSRSLAQAPGPGSLGQSWSCVPTSPGARRRPGPPTH